MQVPFKAALAAIFALFVMSIPALAGDDWKPIDPAETAMKTPVVDKDADAEVLFWEVRIDDGEIGELVYNHYVRLKVFTERGKESQSKVDIPYLNGSSIKDIAARTIKADGSIIELKKEDILERTIVKTNGLKLKAKSFAVPGIDAGVIVEYKWREVHRGRWANNVRLVFQREIPVQKVTYLIRPYGGDLAMRYEPFQMPTGLRFNNEKNGFHSATLVNVPAFKEESRMPPEDSVKSWVLLYYTRDDGKIEPAKYWKNLGKQIWDDMKGDLKPNDEVKRVSAEVVGDATTPEQKLARIYEYCQTKIKNMSNDAAGLTSDEREKLKANKSPGDTLKKAAGTSADIDRLFAAMASAAGFEPRLAFVADRSDILFNPNFTNPYFLEPSSIAIKLGEKWTFYNPGYSYLPFGMLRWQEEGQDALIADSKEPVWAPVPLSGPEKTLTKRVGRFRLLEDGTLEGEVTGEMSGQRALEYKHSEDDESAIERESSLRDGIKARLSTAEVTDLKIENVTDPTKPYVYSYKVRVPGYAQRTGKRLFLQPDYFARNVDPMFSSSARKNLVYFNYPWSEQDDVEIKLPEGYALDNADAPASFGSNDLSQYKVSVAIRNKDTIVYKRSFFFGGGGTTLDRVLYPTASYPALKQYFDAVNKNDNHTITLKQGAATASAAGAN